MSLTPAKVAEATDRIARVIKSHTPVVAFSGGKDALVVSALVQKLSPMAPMIGEISFLFPEVKEDIAEIANKLGYNATFWDSLSDQWLVRNRKVIFSNDNKVRMDSFFKRQQATIKKFSATFHNPVTITGRRRQENNVPDCIYKTKAGLQAHPIYDWSKEDVWEFIRAEGLPTPYIYGTEFGQLEGTAPFYALKAKYFDNDVERCWKCVRDASPRQNYEAKFKNL